MVVAVLADDDTAAAAAVATHIMVASRDFDNTINRLAVRIIISVINYELGYQKQIKLERKL